MNAKELALFDKLVELANRDFDGHFTIMKFTTNWRVSFGTANSYGDVNDMSDGASFSEAATRALGNPRRPDGEAWWDRLSREVDERNRKQVEEFFKTGVRQ